MAELYKTPGSQAVRLIQRGNLTVEEYAKSLISRFNQRKHIQAWAYFDPDLILNQARSLDKIPPEKKGPLHGLAVGIKDIALTKGKQRALVSFQTTITKHARHANKILLGNL